MASKPTFVTREGLQKLKDEGRLDEAVFPLESVFAALGGMLLLLGDFVAHKDSSCVHFLYCTGKRQNTQRGRGYCCNGNVQIYRAAD